ncbi:glycoside hydrolase family 3 domain protein [Alkalidesulfovibrio alkalitolerans DSM 16529]|uniref:Glycoside hydrolase family 3 domain protein n=1 Tax=Alkalidesulfovibrio alkalitolerans DSM 16529 TaxID=1121439 RepID=S7T1T7_9BACT|nr:glycoside hydrolase family 3 N-terminal domain-containing protein [Alkalidesulfovibrio alkalitolerans]EPR31042.1 glycoside hydrolase family 3 domain protein [Alkalidesulfovibrio alkalitolerans DSM 16529]
MIRIQPRCETGSRRIAFHRVLAAFLCLLFLWPAGLVAQSTAMDPREEGGLRSGKATTFEEMLHRHRLQRLKEHALLTSERAWKAREDHFAARLSGMSLREKVGQVFMVTFPGDVYTGDVADLVENWKVGGVMLYGAAGNVGSPRQVKRLTDALRDHALVGGKPLPLFISVDQEGGPVARLRDGFTVFPSAMSIAATGSPENAALAARLTARELLAVGVNVNFAPVADVNTNPDNPIIGLRSYGSSPYLVAAFVRAAVRAYGEMGLLATAKHFPGHGEADIDSHLDLPVLDVDRDRLANIELPPFFAAEQQGVPMIMTAHIALPKLHPESPDLPATLSHRVLTGLLREQMEFPGLIVTDSMFMGAIMQRYGVEEAALTAFEAGADILLYGADLYARGGDGDTVALQKQAMEALYQAVRSGRIPAKRLDESVERILRAKARIAPGLHIPEDDRYALIAAGDVSAVVTAERMAAEGVTIVRHQDFFPLPEDGALVVVYPRELSALADAFRVRLPWARLVPVERDPGEEDVVRAVNAAKNAVRVVAVVTDCRKFSGQERLVRALGERAAVVAAGLPYDLALFPSAPLLVATYGPHPGALAVLPRLLEGEFKPRGTLPVELPGLGGIGFSDSLP